VSTGKALGRAAGLIALKGLAALVQLLPLPAGLAVGRRLGDLMRLLSRKRRHVAMKNLCLAFGDSLTQAQRQKIVRESFQSFGMFPVEVMKFGRMEQEEADRRVDISSLYPDILELQRHGKGILLITGHIGNFEIGARCLTSRGHEVIALARESRDRGTTEMMTRARARLGIRVVTLRQSLRPVLAGLKRNAIVAIICDQNAADVFVPFFGHLTGTADGPARLALKTGAPLLFFCTVRRGSGRYAALSYGHLWAEPTGDTPADVQRITAELNRRLEQMIRDYPGQWLWFHDRWKSSPVGRSAVLPAVS